MSSFEERTTEALGSVPSFLNKIDEKRQPVLLVLKGPNKGATFPLNQPVHTLGRSAAMADIVLEGRGLSRAHAKIQLAEGALVAVDLDSTNGVFLNGERITNAQLKNGDVLGLGPEVTLRLETPDESVRELLEDLYTGATKDGLTGVLNRKSFLQRLQEEYAATRRHALDASVALLDVDHFKSINDNYGHPAGDAVLVELAQRLQTAIRAEDVLGRYGGEEFIVLIRHSPLNGALVLLERIRQAIAGKPFLVPTSDGERAITVTISAGLCAVDSDRHWEFPIKKADEALYEAKSQGRNRVVLSTL
ncbi:MAG: GGDEF domain-containing protein [Candidatus Eremiobacteraeota bacterium]|nr:GGDEF domain-containing protein [Candidatus Eremiobacteraeota bacterium]